VSCLLTASSAISYQLSAISQQHKAFFVLAESCELSADRFFSHQLSAISYQLSANSIKPFIVLAESCELSADRWFLEGATQAPV